MRRLMGIWAATCVLAGMCVMAAWGQQSSGATVPRLIRFNGVVRQVGEKPARGVVELSFSLFKEESGGEPLWFESQTVEVDAQGRYNVLLGAMHADGLPMDLFTSGEARWLSIMVGKFEQPRVLLVSVPYALKAGDAESLGGKPAAAFVAADQLKEQVATAMSDPKIGLRTLNTMVMASGTGTTTPPALVNETVPATFTCTVATNCVAISQSGAAHALFSQATATSGAVYGVYGFSASSTGRGVFGQAGATTGVNYGVRGLTGSTSGYGVYGVASAVTGTTFGVAGSSSSTSGRGIFGDASALTGSTFGLFGQASSVSGVGLQGSAAAVSGATIGVRAVNFSPAGTAAVLDNLGGGKLISARTTGFVEKFAVSAAGNVTAAGTVTGASASFAGAVSGGAFTGTSFTGDGSALTGVNATTLDGIDSTGFAPALGSVAYVSRLGDVMAGQLVLPANGLAAGGSQLVLTSGRVGVGIINPNAQLHVDGTDATDGAGASAIPALLAVGGNGGDAADTAGSGGNITLISGTGGAATGGNNGGDAANLTVSGGIGGTSGGGGAGGSITLSPGAGGSGGAGGAAGNILLTTTGVGNVGIGTSSPAQKLEVNGGVRLNTVTARPLCTAAVRGTLWFTQGGTGEADTLDVCIKKITDDYEWNSTI